MTIQNILKGSSILKNAEKCDHLTEQGFLDNVENDAVESLTIIQTKEGKFILVVKLTWKESLNVIVTMRRTVREWVNFDRMAKHISEKYPSIPNINIVLNKKHTMSQFSSLTDIKDVTFDDELLKLVKVN